MKYSREYFIAQFPFISTRDNHFLCNDHAHELHYIIDFASFTRDITFVPKHKLKRFLNLFQAVTFSERVCKFYNRHWFENDFLHSNQLFFKILKNKSTYIRDYNRRKEKIFKKCSLTDFFCNIQETICHEKLTSHASTQDQRLIGERSHNRISIRESSFWLQSQKSIANWKTLLTCWTLEISIQPLNLFYFDNDNSKLLNCYLLIWLIIILIDYYFIINFEIGYYFIINFVLIKTLLIILINKLCVLLTYSNFDYFIIELFAILKFEIKINDLNLFVINDDFNYLLFACRYLNF